MAAADQMYSNKAAEEAWLPDSRLPSHGSVEKLNSSSVNRLLMELLIYFGRAVFLLYPVYLTGYLGLSISWMLLCMVLVTWWKKNRQWKDARIGTAIEFVDKETEVVHNELRSALQMASWVCTYGILKCLTSGIHFKHLTSYEVRPVCCCVMFKFCSFCLQGMSEKIYRYHDYCLICIT